jgi:hypothetical protein
MAAIETIQPGHTLVEDPVKTELVLPVNHTKLTKWDKEIMVHGGDLPRVENNSRLEEVHETNNLLRNLETLELPADNMYRQAFELFYEQTRLKELIERVRKTNPGLYAQAMGFAKKRAKDFLELQAQKTGSPKHKELSMKQMLAAEAESRQAKISMSNFWEAIVDAAPFVFADSNEAQLALDSIT